MLPFLHNHHYKHARDSGHRNSTIQKSLRDIFLTWSKAFIVRIYDGRLPDGKRGCNRMSCVGAGVDPYGMTNTSKVQANPNAQASVATDADSSKTAKYLNSFKSLK